MYFSFSAAFMCHRAEIPITGQLFLALLVKGSTVCSSLVGSLTFRVLHLISTAFSMPVHNCTHLGLFVLCFFNCLVTSPCHKTRTQLVAICLYLVGKVNLLSSHYHEKWRLACWSTVHTTLAYPPCVVTCFRCFWRWSQSVLQILSLNMCLWNVTAHYPEGGALLGGHIVTAFRLYQSQHLYTAFMYWWWRWFLMTLGALGLEVLV